MIPIETNSFRVLGVLVFTVTVNAVFGWEFATWTLKLAGFP
jgi:hypothetical protein